MRDIDLDVAMACAVDYYLATVQGVMAKLQVDCRIAAEYGNGDYTTYGHGKAVDQFLSALAYNGYEIVPIHKDVPALKAVSA